MSRETKGTNSFAYFLPTVCVVVFATINSGLARPAIAQQDPDRSALEAELALKVSTGTIEEKREALYQIRNHRSARSSRIAVAALQDADEMVRATAVAAVVFLPEDEATTVLTPLLSDRQPFVRRETAYALEQVGSALATARLIEIFQRDRDLEVRGAAAVALGATGDILAVPALTDLLRRPLREDHVFLRRSAARSIGEIALSMREIDLSSMSERKRRDTKRDPESKVQKRSLADVHPQFRVAASVLADVLGNRRETDDSRREAAFALGSIGGEGVIPLLESYKNSEDPYLAETVRTAVSRLRSRE
jgi:HEAT repeat protein